MNTTEEKKLVGQTAYETIRFDIVNGNLPPGEKLKLNGLQKRYGVSVNTLRETLMRLVSEGFVLFEDQKGFRVNAVSLRDFEELIELRSTLELLGLSKSMANTKNLIEWKSRLISAHYRLTVAQKGMMADESGHTAEWEKADREFHMAIVSNCGSNQLIRYHSSVLELFMRYQVLALKKRPFRGQSVVDEHQSLLDSLLNDEFEKAEACLREHIGKGAQVPL
ncbi:GntR family transcriptional regulator [Oceanobacter mangrovi]|uniref:GntR family transcriptional regulator n=1 Tax=Oceanobacter mangrovi TaxID=2862510 RepID=UPI001C8D7D50|nr:GntR family transcriptional regulator [Oceanobacter mangrovi]